MVRHHHMVELPAESLVDVACAVCGSRRRREIGIDNGYRIQKCAEPDCGFVYVSPRPMGEQIEALYAEFYDADEEVPEIWEDEMGAIFRECADWLCADRAKGRVLDVGCAFGHFLVSMEARGWETVGIEPSPVAAAAAAGRLRGDVHTGVFEDLEVPGASFDALVAVYVLEHVALPREFLAKMRRVLRPGGLAIVRVPYNEPILPLNRLLGRSLMAAPAHLNDFSPRTLRRLALDVGFAGVDVRVGARRRASDPVERIGAAVLGGTGRVVEIVTGGRRIFPWVGSLSYRLRA
jgi:SAM-dependent methyltransferase